MFSAIRRLFGVKDNELRLEHLEDKIDSLEDKVVTEKDLEVIKDELQDIKQKETSNISKGDKAKETILKLLQEGHNKSSIKDRILELDICSETHFYRVWNNLEDKGYIVDNELVVELEVS